MRSKTRVIVPSLCLTLLWLAPPARANTLSFAGFTWNVREQGSSGPGPNEWRQANAFLDSRGALHLRVEKRQGKWTCAEVYTTSRLGFGTYQFQLRGKVDTLDKNLVLGLFTYPTADVGPDATNEIDIEFARWGSASAPALNYTVYPARSGPAQATRAFNIVLPGDASTHRFTWASDSILFQSFSGYVNDNRNQLAQWLFKPAEPLTHVPQAPVPLHLNFWLFQGQAPSNGKNAEVVITGLTFRPR